MGNLFSSDRDRSVPSPRVHRSEWSERPKRQPPYENPYGLGGGEVQFSSVNNYKPCYDVIDASFDSTPTATEAQATAECRKPALPLPNPDIFADAHNLLRSTGTKRIAAPNANLISGPYADVTQYLRTHLDLLHADYFAALQEGIAQLREQMHSPTYVHSGLQSNSSFWVYEAKRIVLQIPRPDRAKFVVTLSADEVQRLQRAEQSRDPQPDEAAKSETNNDGNEEDADEEDETETKIPFMTGSLLLFASSMALTDLVLATVVNTDLEEKTLQIRLMRVFNCSAVLNHDFIMLEPKIFFDPHHQVYRKIASLTDATFPMAEQLIRVSTQPMPPDYQLKATANATYYTRTGFHALPLRQLSADSWPTPDQLGYNASQVLAIRHALTHRMAMIQGPPGTGKSFVGLELVSLLLHNTKHRIVIVCNSNQALDQFLAGLVKTTFGGADTVVRLGGQCKEPALKLILKSDKEDSKAQRTQLFRAHQAISECNEELGGFLRSTVTDDCYESHVNGMIAKTECHQSLLDELRQTISYDKIETKRVIGMTSSFAAKNGTLLELLKAPIVIVEEAGEMLESHVIAALTSHTEHLIQIGDHKQLRPRTCSMSGQIVSHLDCSLFERLHNNRLPGVALRQQHRMHPLIADLVRPSIYPDLIDAAKVRTYPPIRGMPARLMFVDHKFPEKTAGTSKTNPAEAHLVQRLCAYLLQQGYAPDDITVLCTYRAQLSLLATNRRTGKCNGCRVAVVDGFQGRESRIVLLSLVRNNRKGNVGFMEAANRACVALTRAREGLIMFGNMQLLAARSQAWKHVQSVLMGTAHGIGRGQLVLCCEQHRNMIKIMKARDFAPIQDGGCTAKCGVAVQSCGHVCEQQCHGVKIGHVCVKCRDRATKKTNALNS